MEYAEKLRDPRWQKKRLKILERDQFTCRICGDNQNTLHIHHTRYSGEPWEVDDLFLLTVCEKCHDDLEELKKFKKRNSYNYPGASLRQLLDVFYKYQSAAVEFLQKN